MIPQSFIQDLLGRTDIVDVIERHVRLRKAGANYAACCPFHSEKTPSFTVSPTKQFYHCFGCGAHGSAVGFLMEYEGLSFVEAVNALARRAGMQVPSEQPQPRGDGMQNTQDSHSVQDLFEVMGAAARFYRQQLKSSGDAINYLKKRGLTGETAARFGIGYAPADWQNLDGAFHESPVGVPTDLLVEAGLVVRNDEGRCYSRFRDRIMFPILNVKGKLVGFGGRVLGSGEPKYLNSPETPLFQKGRELYNLFGARRAIREAGKVIVVEGYMDVVALSQHGVEYAVATLGTAITPFHVQKLLRQTDEVIFCFDGDQAGRKAAWRALEDSLDQLVDGKSVRFLFLPEGDDPDSYIRARGKNAFEEQVRQSLPLSIFLFRELSARVDLKTSEGRAGLVQEARPLLARVAAPGFALMLIKQLVEISGFTQRELEDLLKIRRTSFDRVPERLPRPKPASPYHWLIQILLHNPGYIGKLDRELLIQDHEYSDEIAALTALIEFIDAHPHVKENTAIPASIAYFDESPHRLLLQKVESETLAWDSDIDLEAEFAGAMARLHNIRRKQRMTSLQNKALSALTPEEKQELQRLAVSCPGQPA
jgi:DNA primase